MAMKPFTIGIVPFIIGIVLLAGCTPVHSADDEQIGGNLIDIQFVTHSSTTYNTVVLKFEGGEVHKLTLHDSTHYKFHLNRINNVWYDNMGIVTKVEVLE